MIHPVTAPEGKGSETRLLWKALVETGSELGKLGNTREEKDSGSRRYWYLGKGFEVIALCRPSSSIFTRLAELTPSLSHISVTPLWFGGLGGIPPAQYITNRKFVQNFLPCNAGVMCNCAFIAPRSL